MDEITLQQAITWTISVVVCGVGVLNGYIAYKRSRKDKLFDEQRLQTEAQQERLREQQRRNDERRNDFELLMFKTLLSAVKMSEACAVAIVDKKLNGELTAAKASLNEANTAMESFVIKNGIRSLEIN